MVKTGHVTGQTVKTGHVTGQTVKTGHVTGQTVKSEVEVNMSECIDLIFAITQSNIVFA